MFTHATFGNYTAHVYLFARLFRNSFMQIEPVLVQTTILKLDFEGYYFRQSFLVLAFGSFPNRGGIESSKPFSGCLRV